ncbi:MAG: InlB B-repeat-containing protein [Endomicrobia bacterium]|nr:InlB B-repeat-containing protein [Endomicrobiia bacterium]
MKKSISFVLSISLVLFSLSGCAKKSKSPTNTATTTYTLVVVANPQQGGTILLNPPGGTYNAGTVVTVVATANSGYVFSGWSGDLSGSQNPATVVMNTNKTIIANFTPTGNVSGYTLTVNISPLGAGSVSINPSSATYTAGTQVTLTATANSGYTFSSWSGDVSSTTSSITIIMDSNKTITANFTQSSQQQNYTLTVNVVPTGAGVVYFNPSGGVYTAGTQVTLTATANSGYTFSSWSGDVSSTTSSIIVTMNSNKTITANFTQTGVGGTTYTLLVSIDPSGAGTVNLNPSGGVYTAGTQVTLTAVPNSGYQFDGWSGNLTGTTNPATITMNSNKVVTANFSQQQQQTYTLTVSINPTGGGSVVLNPAGGTYVAGTQVTLTATASSGYVFSGWSGDLTGTTNPATITMNSNKVVTASFSEQQQTTYTLTTNVSPTGAGSVTLNPSGGVYTAGTTVVLTATANSGYQFLNWTGDVTGTSNPTTIVINSNKTVTANFEQIGQDTARYNFEASVQGWVHQTYTDSQAITAVARDTSKARYGSASLRCTVNLQGSHANYSKGETFVDLQTPVNLSNATVTVWVWIPTEATGTPPNGIQVFFKDSAWNSKYSSHTSKADRC